jgi:Ni/Fe-hydrogenase subunit HybB-like protein
MAEILFGFVFPNERVYWEIPIVIYPFLTCIATGTFFLSTLDHLFKQKSLKPVSNLALLASMAFVCFASLPLLLHLGHPERAFNIMFTPSISSAMATFGYIYGFYLGLVFLEVWFVFRPKIVQFALAGKGIGRAFYSILSLGVRQVTPGASRIDHGIIRFIAFLRVPTACVLSGYVGLIFGTLDAVPLWSWRLMPVIFLLSAVACGIGLIVVLYAVAMKVKGWRMDSRCVRSMAAYLLTFLLLTGLVQLINFLRSNVASNPDWQFAFQTLKSQFTFSFIGLQLIAGWVVPVVLLLTLLLLKMKDGLRNALTVISSILVVVHVFTFLWNLVLGGQLGSKSLRGSISFQPELLGKEGILASAVVVVCPLILLYVLTKILPPFEKKAEETG